LGFRSAHDKFWRAKTDGTFEETGNKPPFVMDFEAGSFLSGVSMKAQSMSLEQINKIKAFGESVSDEWGKFEKNPWGYVADPCTEYIEKKVESLKKNAEDLYNQTGKAISDTYNQAGKAISDIWNSW
jgi:archaellum component FlaC